MPRNPVIGNGWRQVMFDAAYRLRDVYPPQPGQGEPQEVLKTGRWGLKIPQESRSSTITELRSSASGGI
jgi:hypothetical protein